jgi:NAD(P)-dependent dehydrogenase (short-subunit alcohol dehydrogenase family)
MRIIITGASSGLGLASAESFAKEGHNIVMIASGSQRLERAASELAGRYPQAQIETQVLDLSDFEQVREFANNQQQAVDILMNNAGLMGPEFALSNQGIEQQFATNHLGHFLLTKSIWAKLEQASSPRVISLSSVVHRRGNLRNLSLNSLRGASREGYDRWQRYADSKLACLMFAKELDIRGKQHGSRVLSIAAHPGWAITGLQENYPHVLDRLAQTAAQGAQSQVYAATAALTGGEFVGPRFELWGKPRLIRGSKHSQDSAVSQRLWDLSEEIVGERFLS